MERHYRAARWTCALALTLASGLEAQHKVDARNLYERIWARVPFAGKGTFADPKRPLYAPVPSLTAGPVRTGIIGFTYQTSDDGMYALVEFVARDRSAFQQILADTSPEVKSFVPGIQTKQDMETEFKKYKKNFDFTHFGVRMP